MMFRPAVTAVEVPQVGVLVEFSQHAEREEETREANMQKFISMQKSSLPKITSLARPVSSAQVTRSRWTWISKEGPVSFSQAW